MKRGHTGFHLHEAGSHIEDCVAMVEPDPNNFKVSKNVETRDELEHGTLRRRVFMYDCKCLITSSAA